MNADRLAESEAHYRTHFNRIDEGFCIIEFIDGPHGPSSNYKHIEAKPACEPQLDIANMVGTTIRDIGLDEAEGRCQIYGRVLQTGEPIRFEREFVTNGGRLEVAAHRVEPASRNQVAVLFRNIMERTHAVKRLEASEALAPECGAGAARASGRRSWCLVLGSRHWRC